MPGQQRFNPRDEVYLNSTGFEPYMAAGVVFLILFTAGFVLGLKLHFVWLFWPGCFVAVLGGYIVLKLLERRARARKLAELEAEERVRGPRGA